MSAPGSAVVLQKVLTFLRNGDAAGADILLTSFLARSPEDADGQNLAGLIKQQLGELGPATEHFRAAVKADPGVYVYRINLGAALLSDDQPEAALAELEAAEQDHPEVPELHVNLADALVRLNRTAEAEAHLRQALNLRPGFVEAAVNLSSLLQSQGRFGDAADLVRPVLSEARDDPAAMRFLGMAELKAGQQERAVRYLSIASELEPERIDILVNLGVAQKQAGQLEAAERTYREALRQGHDDTGILNNLGNVLASQGKSDEAERVFRQALDQTPDDSDVRKNLALLLQDQGQFEAAIDVLDQGLAFAPFQAGLLMAKGNTLRMLNKFEEAAEVLQEALRAEPDVAEAHNNYALVQSILDDLDGAEASFKRAIDLNPDEAVLHNNLGALQIRAFKLDEAVDALNRSMALNPDYVDPMRNYAMVRYLTGEVEEARAAYRRVLELAPDDLPALHGLAIALWEDQLLAEAEEKALRVLELNPDYSLTRNLLGVLRVDERRVVEGLDHMKRAAERDIMSAPAFLSNYLFSSMYDPGRTNLEVFEDHKAWGERFTETAPNKQRPHRQNRSPERKLRIGYVSPDFRAHSVAYFFEPIMQHHDRGQYEVFCYSNTIRTDVVTEGIKNAADGWVETSGLTDEQMMQRLRADELDILINLGGHTAYNRMRALACQTAPIQIEYLGYPHTSGVPAMGYRISDDRADPAPAADAFVTEQLIRMEHCFHCYRPHGKAPEPGPPPHKSAGHFTFASFNMLTKVNDDVIDAWARILHQVPDSRFLIKCKQLNEPSLVQAIKDAFQDRGIIPSRLTLTGFVPSVKDHLTMYGQVDLALDTFPYNGTTTTCEAMWMGVPVLTIEGDRHAARVGLSLMHAMDLVQDLVVPDVESYIDKAVALAQTPDLLDELRPQLRDRMAASPLRDESCFTRELEGVYRRLWKGWCAGPDTYERLPPKRLDPDESLQGLLNEQL